MSKHTLLSRPTRHIRPIFTVVGIVIVLLLATAWQPPASPPPLTAFTSFTLPASAASLSLCGNNDPFCLGSAAFKGGVVSSADAKVSPAAAVGKIIQMLLGLIGVLFFGLMFWGGFRWMTARGNQENAESGKQTLENATIGFLVVLIAYALTTYIVSNLFKSSGTGDTYYGPDYANGCCCITNEYVNLPSSYAKFETTSQDCSCTGNRVDPNATYCSASFISNDCTVTQCGPPQPPSCHQGPGGNGGICMWVGQCQTNRNFTPPWTDAGPMDCPQSTQQNTCCIPP